MKIIKNVSFLCYQMIFGLFHWQWYFLCQWKTIDVSFEHPFVLFVFAHNGIISKALWTKNCLKGLKLCKKSLKNGSSFSFSPFFVVIDEYLCCSVIFSQFNYFNCTIEAICFFPLTSQFLQAAIWLCEEGWVHLSRLCEPCEHETRWHFLSLRCLDTLFRRFIRIIDITE